MSHRILFKTMLVGMLAASVSIASASAQEADAPASAAPDSSIFRDSAHHWEDVTGDNRVIEKLPGQERYNPEEVRHIADNILLFLQPNGGWPKNYDMRSVLTDEQIQILREAKGHLPTCFDNGATHSQVSFLIDAYSKTGEERYKNAAIAGLNYMLSAQYDNGGWPQFYPDTSGYRKHITYNDGAMIGIMRVLRQVVRNEQTSQFISDSLLHEIQDAYQRGLECILKTQIIEDGKRTIWCQQHDYRTLEPQLARSYELPSKATSESVGIVQFLMDVNNPSDKVIAAIDGAVQWFRNNKITELRVKRVEAEEKTYKFHTTHTDKKVVQDPEAPPIWARFYELKTNKPFFANRDGNVVYQLSQVKRERRTGYSWYTYDPQRVLDRYPDWKQRISQ